VDISATPFTKLLAIQRMGLKPGESSGLSVAYIAVPEMELKAAGQRYTYLERHSQCGVYMYEALFRGFTAKLPVDADGIVIDYPQTFSFLRKKPHAVLVRVSVEMNCGQPITTPHKFLSSIDKAEFS
jgi:hypothetical protein